MNQSYSSRLSVLAALLLTAVSSPGCERDAAANDSKTQAPNAASAALGSKSGPAANTGAKKVDLKPLPLTITLPASEAAKTMDKTMDNRKSVAVSYDKLFAGLNIAEPMAKNFDEVKKGVKGDTILYPFKKFVKESATHAIAEVTAGGKTGYTAWAWKSVGGKSYLCQSTGMNGLRSVGDAETALKACDTLAAK